MVRLGVLWATKLEVLEFIEEREVVGPTMLMSHFGYRRSGATERLRRLRRLGLVVNIGTGEWTLTEAGYDKIAYLKSRGG